VSKLLYVGLSISIAFIYVIVLVFDISPKLLYLLTMLLFALSIAFLFEHRRAKREVIVFVVILMLSFIAINENGLSVITSHWESEAYISSSRNEFALGAFICLSNAFVWSTLLSLLFKRRGAV